MHDLQKRILTFFSNNTGNIISLRALTRQLGEKYPQRVKHHIEQLRQKGLINYDAKSKILSVYSLNKTDNNLVPVPIRGAANCGDALEFADDFIDGILYISKKIIGRHKNVFALRAVGDSMNNSNIQGKSIEDGDYVLIDPNNNVPKENNYVLSVIGGAANIKKIHFEHGTQEIHLISQSKNNIPPIVIHEDDIENNNYLINGNVFGVIKKR